MSTLAAARPSSMSIRAFKASQLQLPNGATIAIADWPGTKGPLVCVHGLTSSSRAFGGLATELPDYRIVAVDCRGRGESSKAAPFGMEQHAQDLAGVMDALGIARATLIGHSMGAYVVGAFSEKYPQRVDRAVFVDGGYFLALPAGVDPATLLQTMLGTFLEKIRRTWTSLDEYIGYYEGTPIYPEGVDAYGRFHFEYDLTGKPPELRSKIVESCIAPDWRDVLDHAAVSRRLRALHAPLTVVRAPGGLMGDGNPVVSDAVRDSIVACVPSAKIVDVPGTNHHTILFSSRGAKAVANVIRG